VDKTLSAAIDRATVQLEASTDDEVRAAWRHVLDALTVTIDHDDRLDAIEARLDRLEAER
jgi:hypothetical protein